MVRKVLLVCGILSSLLYVATDILGSLRYEGYSYTSQTVSELSAIGAPTRPLVVPLFLTYGVLVIAFGLGVCLGGPFTPMHLREVLATGGPTLTDTLHKFGAMVDALFLLLIIGFGATAFGKRFRLYSIGTILVLVVFGALAGLDAPRIEANLPTPWAGVTERICIFGSLLWVAVLATVLLRELGRKGGLRP